jgi:cytoskeletal protein CcmA (bactofilin family)
VNAVDASTQRRPVSPSPAPISNPVAEASSRVRDEAGKRDSRLIVGPDVKLKGAEILDCDTLVVEGRVDATMDSRVLRIADGGAFEGKVGVDVAEIHGRFDGELTVREQLVIHAGGRVSGKIRYGSIFIEEGGQICGDIMASEVENGASRATDRGAARSDARENEALAV